MSKFFWESGNARNFTLQLISILVFSSFVVACGIRVGNPDDEEEEDQGASAKSGVTFFLADAPVDDASKVLISIEGLEIAKDGEEAWISIPLLSSEEIDLLSLQNGNSIALAALDSLTPGTYASVRLQLAEQPGRVVWLDGQESELSVPSGHKSGLKIVTPFEVLEDEKTELTIDFDVRKSLVKKGSPNGDGEVVLKPTLRLVDNNASGSLVEEVDAEDGAVVCVYAAEVEPDEESNCPGAVTSAIVAEGEATIPFLPYGEYMLVLFPGDGSRVEIGLREVGADDDP